MLFTVLECLVRRSGKGRSVMRKRLFRMSGEAFPCFRDARLAMRKRPFGMCDVRIRTVRLLITGVRKALIRVSESVSHVFRFLFRVFLLSKFFTVEMNIYAFPGGRTLSHTCVQTVYM